MEVFGVDLHRLSSAVAWTVGIVVFGVATTWTIVSALMADSDKESLSGWLKNWFRTSRIRQYGGALVWCLPVFLFGTIAVAYATAPNSKNSLDKPTMVDSRPVPTVESPREPSPNRKQITLDGLDSCLNFELAPEETLVATLGKEAIRQGNELISTNPMAGFSVRASEAELEKLEVEYEYKGKSHIIDSVPAASGFGRSYFAGIGSPNSPVKIRLYLVE